MDMISLILVAIAVLLAVISLVSRCTTFRSHFSPSIPEDEIKDQDPPEESLQDSRFDPTDIFCNF